MTAPEGAIQRGEGAQRSHPRLRAAPSSATTAISVKSNACGKRAATSAPSRAPGSAPDAKRKKTARSVACRNSHQRCRLPAPSAGAVTASAVMGSQTSDRPSMSMIPPPTPVSVVINPDATARAMGSTATSKGVTRPSSGAARSPSN